MTTQSRLRCTRLLPQCRFFPRECSLKSLHPVGSPRKLGRHAVCHYSSPNNLNFQHTPRFGQPRQAPETSSICPLTLLLRLPSESNWLEYCIFTIYYITFISNLQQWKIFLLYGVLFLALDSKFQVIMKRIVSEWNQKKSRSLFNNKGVKLVK